MPICSYLVIPDRGVRDLHTRLVAYPGCDVVPAENRGVLLIVTDTRSEADERELRERIERTPGVARLVMTFGEIDPDTEARDPLAEARRSERRVP